MDKSQLRQRFSGEWEKHYQIEALTSKGFQRKQCNNCKRFFWALDPDRQTCADSECMGYEFIGKKTHDYSYVETWKKISEYFTKRGHTEISRFPVVSRWRDDLYFTNASIIDFQPYVVTGEVEPPANPLIVPQTCLRFNDVENVGVTGRHHTCFVMFGQHAFNNKEKGDFYWKKEALEHDFGYLTEVIGVKPEDLTFQEEVWAGGGTFGPSIEYAANGAELGNCVFMQYETLPDGSSKELSTKVIDMGAGLERLAWYTQGTPTSYDVAFPSVMEYLKKQTGVNLEEELFAQYSKWAGLVNMEDQDVRERRAEIAQKVGLEEKELFSRVMGMQALYATADHLKAILYATTDGMLPSNAGGGYNLRLLMRRAFGFNAQHTFNLDFAKILELHVKELQGFDDSLKEGLQTTIDVVKEEQKKHALLQESGKQKMSNVIERLKREQKPLEKKELVTLYESHGIPYELAVETAKKSNLQVEEIFNFYEQIRTPNEKKPKKTLPGVSTEQYPATQTLYYDQLYQDEFEANVLGVEGNHIVLDRTLFYPEGGGQSFDTGKINEVPVRNVQKIQNVILHEVEDASSFSKGQKIKGFISRERRANLMHNHTVTHLVNATCRKVLGNHIWQAGAHKEWNKAHLDITHYKKVTPEQAKKIEVMVNEYIQQMIPVKKTIMDRGEAEQKHGFRIYQGGFVPGKELRLVEIEGLDIQACGGTHINNTGEIGFFKIIKVESIQDGIERITYATGIPALNIVQEKEGKLRSISQTVGVPEKDIVVGIQKMQDEFKRSRKRAEELQHYYLKGLAQELKAKVKGSKIVEKIDSAEIDAKSLNQLAQILVNENPTFGVVLVGTKAQMVVAMSGQASTFNAKDAIQIVLSHAKGTGGGSEKVGQAKLQSLDGIEASFTQL